MFSLDSPKHIFTGLKSGCYNLGFGLAIGGISVIYIPFEALTSGFKESHDTYLSKFSSIVVGLVKSLALSVFVGVLAPLAGFITGSVQVIRGGFNTGTWIGHKWIDRMEWDSERKEWYSYYLENEVREVLSVSEEEFIMNLTKKNKKSKDAKYDKNRKVKERGLYELLNVDVNASSSEIKKNYYLLARKFHPDKNKNNPSAKEKFQKIGEAYQILSEEKLRRQYDLLGEEAVQNESTQNLDPVLMFSFIFGNEKFVSIIGELYYSMLVTSSVHSSGSDSEFAEFERFFGGDKEYSEILSYKQKRREVQCAVNLSSRIDEYYSDNNTQLSQKFYDQVNEEAKELSKDKLGKLLLGFIGSVYLEEANYEAKPISFGSLKRLYHVLLLSVKKYWLILRLAVKGLKTFVSSRFNSDSDEAEEQAKFILWKFKDLGLSFLWTSSLLDVHQTLRKVIRKLLIDKSISKSQRDHRVFVIKEIGSLYAKHGSYSLTSSSSQTLVELRKKFEEVFGDFATDPTKQSTPTPEKLTEEMIRTELGKLRISELRMLFLELSQGNQEGLKCLLEKSELVDAIIDLKKYT